MKVAAFMRDLSGIKFTNSSIKVSFEFELASTIILGETNLSLFPVITLSKCIGFWIVLFSGHVISKASLAMAVLSQENVSFGSDEKRNFAALGSFSISSSSGRTMRADLVTSRSLSYLEYSPLTRIIFKRFGSLTTDADSRVSALRSLSS